MPANPPISKKRPGHALPAQPAPTHPQRRGKRPATTHLQRVDNWLIAQKWWVLGAVLLLAAAVRIVLLCQAWSTPLVIMHRWDQTDMSYYDFWAKQILAGDYLSRDIPLPLHGWHIELADQWLKLSPAVKEELTSRAVDAGITDSKAQAEFMQRALWKRWNGPGRFYQEPLYPYLLALTYKITGSDDPRWVFAWQMGLGVASIGLLHLLTRRHFGGLAGAIAGVAGALCTPLLMHEMTLLRDPLIVFFAALLAVVTDMALERRRPLWWLGLGACVGLSIMMKSVFDLFLLGLLAVIVYQCWGQWKSAGAAAGTVLLGVLIALSPVIIRNLVVGVAPLAIAGNNAVPSFVMNNIWGFTWDHSGPGEKNPLDFARVVGESDGHLFKGMWLSLRTHPEVWSVLQMVGMKFDQTWHWLERPDNINIYFYQIQAPILRVPVTYWLVAVPGLLGAIIAARALTRHWSLYLLFATSLAPLILFNVLARYRLPLLAMSLPFAAHLVVQILRWLKANPRLALTTAGVLVLLMAWTGRDLKPARPLVRPADCNGTFLAAYQSDEKAALARGDFAAAADAIDRFTSQCAPDFVREMNPRKIPANAGEAEFAYLFCIYHRDAVLFYRQAQNPAKAAAHEKRFEDLKAAFDIFRGERAPVQ